MLRKKVDYSDLKMSNRTAEERRFLKKMASLMKDNQEREANDEDEQNSGDQDYTSDDEDEEEG